MRHGYAFFSLDLSKDEHWAAYSEDLKVELDYYLKVRSGHWHKIFLLRRLLDADCFQFYVVVDDDVVDETQEIEHDDMGEWSDYSETDDESEPEDWE